MFARRELAAAYDRPARLKWVSELIGRKVESFKDLTGAEATHLIDTLQKSLGITESRPPRAPRKRLSRTAAKAAGTAGRKGSKTELVMASADDLTRINEAVTRLGWTRETLESWLRSPSSPLKGRMEIRTQNDANRVWWGLKPLLKRKGLWRQSA